MFVKEHLDNAIKELEMAESKAGMGTGLMIEPPLDEIKDIRDRFENINE